MTKRNCFQSSRPAAFQSTHPRRVWPGRDFNSERSWHVSIHTPTQGVTLYQIRFIHWIGSFNPHTHAGCDCAGGYASGLYRIVSIHTPTQGVTSLSNSSDNSPHSFNPHTHAGCDNAWSNISSNIIRFNPHTHAGCDTACTLSFTSVTFQSTHPRRVWHNHSRQDESFEKFQSTHPRRVWLYI